MGLAWCGEGERALKQKMLTKNYPLWKRYGGCPSLPVKGRFSGRAGITGLMQMPRNL